MQQKLCRAVVAAGLFLFFNSDPVLAQTETQKFEVGVQFSLVRFRDLNITEAGFGGRFTYNVNRHLAVEAEGDLLPRDTESFPAVLKGGHKSQAFFGLKVGQRVRRFGLFGKIRPGVVNFSNFTRLPEPCNCPIPPPPQFSETNFALDVGGVLEIYTSRRTFIRVDVGDTVVFSNSGEKVLLPEPVLQNGLVEFSFVRSTSHNPHLKIGMGIRLSEKAKSQNSTDLRQPEKRVPRFEAGVQFTSLSVNPHSLVCFSVCLIGSSRSYTEPGGGARFTYNLTNNIGLEAEGNLFPREYRDFTLVGLSGRRAQGQFGVKVGKRFKRLGVFGKVRPGFVSFSRVSYLVSSQTITFFGRQFSVGQFGERKERFLSTDVGGVVEFYISRRLMTRVDVGDTIIRYGEILVPSFILSNAIRTIPPEARHNFQFSAGIGFRFL